MFGAAKFSKTSSAAERLRRVSAEEIPNRKRRICKIVTPKSRVAEWHLNPVALRLLKQSVSKYEQIVKANPGAAVARCAAVCFAVGGTPTFGPHNRIPCEFAGGLAVKVLLERVTGFGLPQADRRVTPRPNFRTRPFCGRNATGVLHRLTY